MRYLTLLCTLALFGCAGNQANRGQVTISTQAAGQPLVGAHCTVTHNTQTWDIVTPATLAIGRADGDLSIRCNQDGYRSSELRITPISGRAGGPGVSLGIGGLSGGGASLFGTGVGLSLPFGSRDIGSYPADITVYMTQESTAE